jgi:hypothetical protein
MQTAAGSPGHEPKRDAIEMAARLFGPRLDAWLRHNSLVPVRLSHGVAELVHYASKRGSPEMHIINQLNSVRSS